MPKWAIGCGLLGGVLLLLAALTMTVPDEGSLPEREKLARQIVSETARLYSKAATMTADEYQTIGDSGVDEKLPERFQAASAASFEPILNSLETARKSGEVEQALRDYAKGFEAAQ